MGGRDGRAGGRVWPHGQSREFCTPGSVAPKKRPRPSPTLPTSPTRKLYTPTQTLRALKFEQKLWRLHLRHLLDQKNQDRGRLDGWKLCVRPAMRKPCVRSCGWHALKMTWYFTGWIRRRNWSLWPALRVALNRYYRLQLWPRLEWCPSARGDNTRATWASWRSV